MLKPGAPQEFFQAPTSFASTVHGSNQSVSEAPAANQAITKPASSASMNSDKINKSHQDAASRSFTRMQDYQKLQSTFASGIQKSQQTANQFAQASAASIVTLTKPEINLSFSA